MRPVYIFLPLIFIISLLTIRLEAKPIEPASSQDQASLTKRKKLRRLKIRKKLKPKSSKVLEQKGIYLLIVISLIAVLGITLFVLGGLQSIFWIWLIGLILWGLVVKLFGLLYLLLMAVFRVGIILFLSLPLIFFSFLAGLIVFLWGIILSLELLWIVGLILYLIYL